MCIFHYRLWWYLIDSARECETPCIYLYYIVVAIDAVYTYFSPPLSRILYIIILYIFYTCINHFSAAVKYIYFQDYIICSFPLRALSNLIAYCFCMTRNNFFQYISYFNKMRENNNNYSVINWKKNVVCLFVCNKFLRDAIIIIFSLSPLVRILR